jgi:hypothetical protein
MILRFTLSAVVQDDVSKEETTRLLPDGRASTIAVILLLDGAKALYADVLVLADAARHCADFVNRMSGAADSDVSVPLAGGLEMAMRL